MIDEKSNNDIRLAWQAQCQEESMIALEGIVKKADQFRTKIMWRNWIEYIAAAVVLVVFGSYAYRFDGLMFRIGCGLIIAATLFIIYHLRKHGSPGTPQHHATLSEHVAFYKKELTRQRDLIRRVVWWYLAPFVPGLAFFLAGIAETDLIEKGPPIPVRIAVITVVFIGIWFLNQWGARRLQRQIDALDQMAT